MDYSLYSLDSSDLPLDSSDVDSLSSDDDTNSEGTWADAKYWDARHEVRRPATEKLRDPSQDRHAILLGSFTQAVKAVQGSSIQEVKSRLWPCGAYERTDPWSTMYNLTLDNIFQMDHTCRMDAVSQTRFDLWRPRHLYFDVPVPQPPDDRLALVPVTVLQCSMQAARAVVRLPATCTTAQAKQTIRQQLEPLIYPPAAVHLVQMHNRSSPEKLQLTLVTDDQQLTAADYNSSAEPDDASPALLVLWLSAEQPREENVLRLEHRYVQPGQKHVLLVHRIMDSSRKVAGAVVQLLPLPCTAQMVHEQATRVAWQALLRGFVTESWYQFMQYYAPAEFLQAHAPPLEFEAYQQPGGGGGGSSSSTPGRSGRGRSRKAEPPPAPPPSAAGGAAAGDDGLVWLVPGEVALLSTTWSSSSVKTHHLATRTLHGVQQHGLQRAELSMHNKRARKALAQAQLELAQQHLENMVEELKLLSLARRQTDATGLEIIAGKPRVAVRLQLECPDPEQPRHGIATFTVWSWPTNTAKHSTVFSPPLSVPSLADMDPGVWSPSSGVDVDLLMVYKDPAEDTYAAAAAALWKQANLHASCRTGPPLGCTLLEMHRGDPAVVAFYDAWMETAWRWKKCEKGITGLLDVLTTGAGPSADQPAGLTVALRPHQRQTLARLLQAEQLPLGYNSWMWCPLARPGGGPLWLSLVLGKLSQVAPPKAPCGGFLCEEMGLGKTIEVLALVLANPAPEMAVPPTQDDDDSGAPPRRPGGTSSSKQQGSSSSNLATGGSTTGVRPGEEMPWTRTRKRGLGGAAGEGDAGAAAAGLTGMDLPPLPPKKKQKSKKGAAGSAAAVAAWCGLGLPAKEQGGTTTAGVASGDGNASGGAADAAAAGLLGGAGSAGPSNTGAGGSSSVTGLLYSRATLVVCAVSLVGQWVDEAEEKTGGSLRILKYHGPARSKVALVSLARDYDVVVTTYATLTADQRVEAAPLEKIHWWRVVFDEGHTLRNGTAATTRAAAALSSDRRWVVTGTPIGGEATDLEGQFVALQLWPFNTPTYFKTWVKKPFHKYSGRSLWGEYGEAGPLPLVHALRCCTTRHTKTQVLEGQAVLQLPPKTEDDIPVVLNAAEQEAYLSTYEAARTIWQRLAAAGPMYVNRHVLQAMGLLTPLRRICSGGNFSPGELLPRDIVLREQPGPGGAAAGGGPLQLADSGLAAPEDQECVVCLDEMESPVVTPCGHWYCRECITSCLQNNNTCPLCRQPMRVDQLRTAAQSAAPGEPEAAGAAAEPQQQQQEEEEEGAEERRPRCLLCDSKLKALIKALVEMFECDAGSKALVFSQYNSTLEWLRRALPAYGLSCRSINGSMSLAQRTKAIEAFQRDPPTTVFLLSMRTGAVGINLTAADHVFILEPCLNPALEEQAVGRAWRLGQSRPVKVKRLYVAGSIEERIVELAKRRRAGTDSRVGALADNGASSSRAASAAAGRIQADTQRLRLNELEALFQPPQLPPAAEVSQEDMDGLKARLAAVLPPELLAQARAHDVAGAGARGRPRSGERPASAARPRRPASARAPSAGAGGSASRVSPVNYREQESSSSSSSSDEEDPDAAARAYRRAPMSCWPVPALGDRAPSSSSGSSDGDAPPATRHPAIHTSAVPVTERGRRGRGPAAYSPAPPPPAAAAAGVDEMEAIRRAAAAARAALFGEQAAGDAGRGRRAAPNNSSSRGRGGDQPRGGSSSSSRRRRSIPPPATGPVDEAVYSDEDPEPGRRGLMMSAAMPHMQAASPAAGRGGRGGSRARGRGVAAAGGEGELDGELAAALAASAAEAAAREEAELREALAAIAAVEAQEAAAAAVAAAAGAGGTQ